MRGINKVSVIGTLGQDPEQRFLESGKAVVNMSLAVNESWKDKQTGEKKERTEWIRVVLFDRIAEVAAEYLKKGSTCYVEGKLTTRKWQNKEGKDQYTTEVVGHDLQLLGGRQESSEERAPARRQESRPSGKQSAQRQPEPESFDDDLPFN